ncbi:hypothetical protein IE81DRAFT_322531 [Ceraceosorus guamensis]|uniref:Uncharacterized protein n=1 Tax=Ceraceosorus guamensis TaxID=1522189 RepID=A0A316W0L7_9BASI|nr:hypothetical protein IE81DRAFT_322531 [Ceraceosorus guamensis]PWN43239.1 hypothetical protein IE81DRAFT_322531 [Ceraceosorus guamensis]
MPSVELVLFLLLSELATQLVSVFFLYIVFNKLTRADQKRLRFAGVTAATLNAGFSIARWNALKSHWSG